MLFIIRALGVTSCVLEQDQCWLLAVGWEDSGQVVETAGLQARSGWRGSCAPGGVSVAQGLCSVTAADVTACSPPPQA